LKVKVKKLTLTQLHNHPRTETNACSIAPKHDAFFKAADENPTFFPFRFRNDLIGLSSKTTQGI